MKAISWRAPYFDLRSGLFVPCVVMWDAETGEFSRVEGPRGFAARDAVRYELEGPPGG